MKEIRLTKGKASVVDDKDFDLLSEYNWCLLTSSTSPRLYAYSRRAGLMHRFILSVSKESEVDHIDGNGLNNQRGNLRLSTKSQNLANKDKYVKVGGRTKSEFKGVDFYENYGSWRARITMNRKTFHLGYFDDEEMAARAYDIAAIELYGEFAKPNFDREDRL